MQPDGAELASVDLAALAAEDAEEKVFNPWSTKGWMKPQEAKPHVDKDNRYFKYVKINARAAAKMLEHANHGVQKGRKRSGMPIEIAGLLIGKLKKETFVVMDTVPLPVEGTEAQVVANDEAAIVHPIRAQPFVEAKGCNFIGWYHSHPFDLQRTPHWFMSGIDCQSQTLFQQAYNGAWCAIVIDPIRSMYKKTLECGSFYCYPPDHNPPSNQGPDGIIATQENIHDRWGNAFKRYYLLETDFFMSNTVKNNLRHVFDDWKQCFGPELRRNETEEVYDVARLRTLAGNMDPNGGGSKPSYRGGKTKIPEGMIKARSMNQHVTNYECRCRGYAQMIKSLIFNVNLDNNTCVDVKMGEN